MVQQIHLQNGLLRTHGLYGKALRPHDAEFRLLRHGEIVRRLSGQALCPQPLGKAGLVLQNLALNIAHGGINSAPHIPVRLRGLRPQDGGPIPDGDLRSAQLVLFYVKGHEGRGILPMKILFQLFQPLFGIGLNGIAQGDLLAGVGILHKARSFRERGVWPSLCGNYTMHRFGFP